MDNTTVFLARLQFGITLTYHFMFVALTLGLSVLIALMETHYVRTGDISSKVMTKFWGKFFLINYSVAIVTGLVNEFQFGMNWSEYSRLVGSIFGPPLAFEALTAFFVESLAIGIWVYGWEKVSPRIHLMNIWLVAVAANYSAFWILSANSFMQHPVGFIFQNGRLELADLFALINNPYLAFQYAHTVLAGWATAGFFLMAVSAYYLLHHQYPEIFRRSFGIGLKWALIATVLVIFTGHFYNQYIANVQPMKMAAAEALWETATPAPFVVFAVIDENNRRNTFQIDLPAGLSVLAYNSLNTPVKGMNDLQAEFAEIYGPGYYIPAVTVLFWSFRVMVGIGFYLVLLVSLICWYWWKKQIEERSTLLKATMWSLPLPYLAIALGWIIAEMGRQPWIVYGLLLTDKGISKAVPVTSVWASLTIYSLVYTFVTVSAVYIVRKILHKGPYA